MDNQNVNNPEMAYDLRQIYAMEVGRHMQEISDARKANNFYLWYKCLEDLKTEIAHKFKSKDDAKEYEDLKNKIKVLANKYIQTWSGSPYKQRESEEIDQSLRELEEFLYKKMQEAGMFGDNKKIHHL